MIPVLETGVVKQYGLEMVVYHLAPGEGRPMHEHPHEHSIFVAQGSVWMQEEGKERKLYTGPCCVYTRANIKHSFEAYSPAVVLNLTKLEDMTTREYL